MNSLELLFVLGVVLALGWVSVFIYQGRKLGNDEASQLLQTKKIRDAIAVYPFFPFKADMDIAFKKSMKSDGSFHGVDIAMPKSASILSSHLKYKKHEWVIFAIGEGASVSEVWCNKGADKKSVYPKIEIEEIVSKAKDCEGAYVFCLHNHPNSGAASLLAPSPQDLLSARWFCDYMSRSKIDAIEFVCDRGLWLVYDFWIEGVGSLRDGTDESRFFNDLNSSGSSDRRKVRSQYGGGMRWSSACPLYKACVSRMA